MKVLNVHTRIIHQPKKLIEALFETLASKNDLMLATDLWPRMKLDNGLNLNSKGGHGPIRYFVSQYFPNNTIEFTFTAPKGFNGIHKFEIFALNDDSTLIKHTIEMQTEGLATLKWIFAIRSLHDAFIEDAFDKVENHFNTVKVKTKWSFWVKFLRIVLK